MDGCAAVGLVAKSKVDEVEVAAVVLVGPKVVVAVVEARTSAVLIVSAVVVVSVYILVDFLG